MWRAPRPAHRTLAGLTAAAVLITQLALPPQAEASHLGSSTASAGSAPPPAVTAIESFQPDLFTGRATTSIPIAVPPGRKGMQPNLALTYSSSARNGWVGVGWSLDAGYIERSTKKGVPKYDSTDTFTFMFQGVASDLVRIPDGTYRARDEGLFLRFEDKGLSGWEVRDKSGARYIFGSTAASQVESGGRVFRWCLDKVVDPHGNGMTVAYTKDGGQPYLSEIRYTTHESTGRAAANRVALTLEDRSDIETSRRAGFEVRTAKRLRAVDAYTTLGGVETLARRWELSYAQSARTNRSLLGSVTQRGADGVTALPPAVFSYSSATEPGYTMATNTGQSGSPIWNVSAANMDTGHENTLPCHPFLGVPWSAPLTQAAGSIGNVSFSSGSDGSFTVSFPQDNFFHAWTSVYTSTGTSIPSFMFDVGCMWIEDAGGLRRIDTASASLSPGWSTVHLTGYHQHEGRTMSYPFGLKNAVTIMNPTQFIAPQLAGDFNGDGITDLATFTPASGRWSVSVSRGSGFSPDTAWLTGFGGASSTPLVGDWNADGRTDIAVYNGGSWQFATSTAAGFQTGTVSPITFGSGTPLTGDFNGDGTVDIGTCDNGSWQAALGTGNGFTPTSSFNRTLGSASSSPLTGDFNGDGLTDIAAVEGGAVSVALSDGATFGTSSTWLTGFTGGEYTSADFNGDGLTDVARYDKPAGVVRVARSTGTAFSGTVQTLPSTFSLRSSDDHVQVGDFNGDGLSDPAVFNTVTSASELTSSGGTFPDLLSAVANGVGGSTAIVYRASTSCDNQCPIQHVPLLPFVLPLVRRVTASDGMGHSYETSYQFIGGSYDAADKEFRGFARVEVRDPEATLAVTEFHQDDQKKGRPFRTELKDASGALWTRTEQTWQSSEPYPGVRVVALAQTDALIFDGDATCRQVRSRFTYDQYGNVTRADEDGEVGIAGDERSTLMTYTLNPSAWIVNKPQSIQTLNANNTLVAQRRLYYDGATALGAAPTLGNLTKEEEWLGPTGSTGETWLGTTLTYDAYGNVLSVTDAKGRTTTNTYDADRIYLTKITNALGHSRELTYDPRFGQVTSSKDQNGVETRTAYDVLGRPVQTGFIDPATSLEVVLSRVAYDPCLTAGPCAPPLRTTATVFAHINNQSPIIQHQFVDGLGRAIQTRSPAEEPAKQVVSGTVEFNTKGQVIKQWVSYLDPAASSYVAPPIASLAPPVEYTYDPLGRTATIRDPDGSTSSTSYNDWTVTSTDANSHATSRTNDAYGRLVKVEEVNGSATYTTTYAYDALGNLVRVTDQAGNVTAISYDSLGRKIAMTDPDMGRWTYAYDAVDNLTSQTDARGATIAFSYDALNRLTNKSYTIPNGLTGVTGQPVSYTYDGPATPFSKGKLTAVADGSGSAGFQYDTLGRLVKETKTITGDAAYTIQRAYDLLGRLTRLTYPDGEVASYTYNPQGGIETVTGQPANGPTGSTTVYVSDIAYNAAGQVTKITYGNGVVSDYTYNPQTLRLDQLKTTGPGGTLQDFRYTFDPTGNVSAIQDFVHTGTQRFTYDPLHRLTRAEGPYGDVSYAYDPVGNLTTKEGVAFAYGAGAAGPHAVTGLADGTVLSYDANGNLKTKVKSGATLATYTWDAENRLSQVQQMPPETTVTVNLQTGWNFFALPVDPPDRSIAAVFGSSIASVAQISRYSPNPEPPTPNWQHWVNNPEFNQFTTLEPGVGYQVYCTQAVSLSVTGKPISGLTKSLAAGWHLVGATQATGTLPLASWLTGVTASQVKTLPPGTTTLAAATQAEPGKAYWVQVGTAGTWTPPNAPVEVTSFVYDGDGGRVKQTTAAGTTVYLGESYEKTGSTTTKYIFAGSQRIASVSNAPTGQPANPQTRFYHGDHLGSSNVITDGSGALVEHTEHSPFGAIHRQERANGPTGQPANPFQFTGQRLDQTGLYFYQARYYDPQLGRFLSPDPFVQDPGDPQTLNRYSYVRNNPINLVDPSGNFFQFIIAAIIAIAAVAAVVSIATGVASLVASATGHERAAERLAKVSQVSAYVSTPLIFVEGGGAVGAAYLISGAAAAAASDPVATAFSGPSFNSTPSTSPLQHTATAVGEYAIGVGITTAAFGALGAAAGAVLRPLGRAAGPSLRKIAARFGPKLGKIRFDPRTGRFRDTATGRFLKAPGDFHPQGGKIALGRFGDAYEPGLNALAVREGARVLRNPFPKGIHLYDGLRAEIDAADEIFFRWVGVTDDSISYAVEWEYISSRPDLLRKTRQFFE
ncbi:MAG: hypothetical protein A3C53_04955 [Omnitrophica WOR_2 bacterium RIFCSPHIGHO2_02_FULL_68_15]|nr:MAG: hypothetical protein A3C53_04955 [Omnitrophica WOR_2 bacterium RIFCSPHIGHO2_02_FULL_68_15]